MSDMKRVNPALMLEAKRIVDPKGEYWLRDGQIYWKSPHWMSGESVESKFNPLTSDSDAFALERALKREGFCFGSWPDGRAWAENRRMMIERMDDPSDTLLLLRCVSQMTGIELHA